MTAAPMHNAQHTKARVPSVYYRARPPLCHPQRGRGAVLHLQGQRAHDQGAQRQGRGDSRHQQVSAFPFFVAVGRYISASHWRHRACLPRRVGLRLCGIRGSGVSVGGLGSLRSSRNNAPANMHLTPLYSPPRHGPSLYIALPISTPPSSPRCTRGTSRSASPRRRKASRTRCPTVASGPSLRWEVGVCERGGGRGGAGGAHKT